VDRDLVCPGIPRQGSTARCGCKHFQTLPEPAADTKRHIFELLQILLEQGVDVKLHGRRPVQKVSFHHNLVADQLLVSGAYVNVLIKEEAGKGALQAAGGGSHLV
jgi:hypothetical protein